MIAFSRPYEGTRRHCVPNLRGMLDRLTAQCPSSVWCGLKLEREIGSLPAESYRLLSSAHSNDLAVFHQEHACQVIGDLPFGTSEGIHHHRTSNPAFEDLELDGCGALHVGANARDRFRAFDCRNGVMR